MDILKTIYFTVLITEALWGSYKIIQAKKGPAAQEELKE